MAAKTAIVTEKGSQSRKVVFTKYTRVLLELWLTVRQDPSEYVFTSVTTGLPLTGSGIAQALSRLKAKARISGRVNPHSFRHAFAREYLMNGGDIATLAKLIGHANINTTAAFYAVFTQDELAELHERRSPLLSLVERGA
jgi:integrase/recombinase XerD